MDNWGTFYDFIKRNNILQGKHLEKYEKCMTADEKNDWNILIEFYKYQGYSCEQIAESYLYFVDMTMEETFFFMESGRYRYNSFEQVAKDVYFNPAIMHKHIIGLGVSQYIWPQHLNSVRWFKQLISGRRGTEYLEIGPGHGEFIYQAIKLSDYDSYIGIDISETSSELTRNYLSYRGVDEAKYTIITDDFMNFSSRDKFSAIVMGEVLEHVEKPLEFLKKIVELSDDETFIFITVPLNSPTKDHIYLFSSIAELYTMVRQAGLEVVEASLSTSNGKSVEKAEKNKETIIAALYLKVK